MSKLITNTVRHTAGSADNITLDNSQNVTVEGNLTVDGTAVLTGAVTLPDNTVTLAKMAGGTDGQIITYDASGDPIAVGPGTDGQVLTSTGAGSPPAFEDAAGGVAGISSSADATAITIDSSERVIVGGTTVSGAHTNNQDFVVGNTSQAVTGMSLVTQSGGYCSIVMSDGQGDKNKGLIGYNHADDTMKICNDPATGSDGLVLQSDHDVKISSGDLLFGTAAKGVVLGATSNTDANTLDDYEEGTWTPAISNGPSLDTARGYYTKIGRVVHAAFHLDTGTDGSNTGSQVHINNLPFTSAGEPPNISAGGVAWDYGTNSSIPRGHVPSNQTKVYFYDQTGAALQGGNIYHFDNKDWRGTATYITAT